MPLFGFLFIYFGYIWALELVDDSFLMGILLFFGGFEGVVEGDYSCLDSLVIESVFAHGFLELLVCLFHFLHGGFASDVRVFLIGELARFLQEAPRATESGPELLDLKWVISLIQGNVQF